MYEEHNISQFAIEKAQQNSTPVFSAPTCSQVSRRQLTIMSALYSLARQRAQRFHERLSTSAKLEGVDSSLQYN